MRWALIGVCAFFACSGEAFSSSGDESAATGGEAGEAATGGTGSAVSGGSSTGGSSRGDASAGGTASEGGEPGTGGAGRGGSGGNTTGGRPAETGGSDQGGSAGIECEPQTFYPDEDGDGYGSKAAPTEACEAPAGFIARGGDCDDDDRAVHPGAPESCDGIDLNCNPTDQEAWCPADCSLLVLTGGTYLVCGELLTWHTASSRCEEQGMALATIRLPGDLTEIQKLPNGNLSWLGGTDEISEGSWIWDGDGSSIPSTVAALWAPDEPKALFADQDCMYGYFGRFYADRCSKEHPFVCGK